MNRGGAAIPADREAGPQGRLATASGRARPVPGPVRRIWRRLRAHCHNTVHEDFAMLMRIQILNGIAGTPQAAITQTPNPTPDGVVFTTPDVLKEA